MKFKDENGNEIDCSVEEYLMLLKLSKEKKDNKMTLEFFPKDTKEKEKEKPVFISLGKQNALNGSSPRWTMEEEELLRKNIYAPIPALMKMLGRSRDAINSKMNFLDLYKVRRQYRLQNGIERISKGQGKGHFTWTEDELRILREHAFDDYEEIHKLIPNKSVIAIRCRISNLHLRKNVGYTNTRVSSKAGKYNTWTSAEEKFLRDNIGSCRNSKQLTKKFNKIFSKRNWNGVYQHVKHLGLSFKKDSLYGKPNVRQRKQDVTKVKDRMQVVHENARKYVKLYGWSYEKARVQAMSDWSNHSGLSRVHHENPVPVPVPMPPVEKLVEMKFWFPLADDAKPIFTNIISNMIKFYPHKLDLDGIEWLHLRNGYSWSDNSFNDFVAWFMYNSEDICKYLKVPNKFKIENDVLVYDG